MIRSPDLDPDASVSPSAADPYLREVRAIFSVLVLALTLPAAASAQTVPPGNSGVDQYQESIPGVGGDRPTGPHGSGMGNASGAESASGAGSASGTDAASRGSRISPSTAKSLDKLGPDGKATAAVAAATAPSRSQGLGGSDSSGDTGPGMGWALPVILALALVAAVSIAVLRWRRGAPPGTA